MDLEGQSRLLESFVSAEQPFTVMDTKVAGFNGFNWGCLEARNTG
jgi:hypothetical protein